MIYWSDRFTNEKYPNQLNWLPVLGNSTIVSCSANTILGNVAITSTNANTTQTVWLEGGEPGRVTILCSVDTSDGRTLATSVQFNNL